MLLVVPSRGRQLLVAALTADREGFMETSQDSPQDRLIFTERAACIADILAALSKGEPLDVADPLTRDCLRSTLADDDCAIDRATGDGRWADVIALAGLMLALDGERVPA